MSDKIVVVILAARCFPGCSEYILIGRRMRNVTGVGVEGNLFQRSGQPSRRERMRLFHQPPPIFQSKYVSDQRCDGKFNWEDWCSLKKENTKAF